MVIKEKWLEFLYKQKCKNKKIIIFEQNSWGNSFVAESPDVLNVYDECKGYGFYHKRLDIKDAIIAKVFRKQNNVAFILITKFKATNDPKDMFFWTGIRINPNCLTKEQMEYAQENIDLEDEVLDE